MPQRTTISITVSVAPHAATGLHALLRNRLTGASTAIEDSDEAAALGAELERLEQSDPEFGRKLRDRWAAGERRADHKTSKKIHNELTGPVTGTVIMVGEVHGEVHHHEGR